MGDLCWSRVRCILITWSCGHVRNILSLASFGWSYRQITYDLYKLFKNNTFQIMYIIKKIPSIKIVKLVF